MSVCAIIAAGGRGVRMAASINKQFLEINNKPIIAYTIEKFNQSSLIDDIVIVVPEEWIEFVSESIVSKYNFSKVSKIVKGGETRQKSIFAGLKELEENVTHVVIHDAVRPLINRQILENVINKGKEVGAAIVAVRAQDTVKRVNENKIESTLNREIIWLAQTPQVFQKDIILKAYQKAAKDNISATDDSALVERMGVTVEVVEGSYSNIKITNPADLGLAEFYLNRHNKK
ncbi:2-C-methyl-D-erythritol 4-phosphate cytidylyltransferase [candidate division KSB1 bacterium]|nr:2-C-methyl-D-erythritol 4-phosphate cytidylyltransferase [candidate division KSB1 bacterium]MBL7092982.1 2-C-methyl-D-erythritol 4-phosphate cytidylyltransferase [candidate division KSB1 bacterium]